MKERSRYKLHLLYTFKQYTYKTHGSTDRLTEKISFACGICFGAMHTTSILNIDYLKCLNSLLEVVDIFCYLGK